MKVLSTRFSRFVAYSAITASSVLIGNHRSKLIQDCSILSYAGNQDSTPSITHNALAESPLSKEVIDEMKRIQFSEELPIGDITDFVSKLEDITTKEKEYFKDEKERVQILTNEINKVKTDIENEICPLLVKIQDRSTFIENYYTVVEKIIEMIGIRTENARRIDNELDKLLAKAKETPKVKEEDLKEIDILRIKIKAQRFGVYVLDSLDFRFCAYKQFLNVLKNRALVNLSIREDPEELFEKYFPNMQALKNCSKKESECKSKIGPCVQEMHKEFDKLVASVQDEVSRDLKNIQDELIREGTFPDTLQNAKEKLESLANTSKEINNQLNKLIENINALLNLTTHQKYAGEYRRYLEFLNFLIKTPKVKMSMSSESYDDLKGKSSLTEIKPVDKSTRFVIAAHIADAFFNSQNKVKSLIDKSGGLEILLVKDIINVPKYKTAAGTYIFSNNLVVMDNEYIFSDLHQEVAVGADYIVSPGISPNEVIPHELGHGMDAISESIFESIFRISTYDGILSEMTKEQKEEFKNIRSELFKIHNSRDDKTASIANITETTHGWYGEDPLTCLPNYAFENETEFFAKTMGQFYANPYIFFQHPKDEKVKNLKIRLYNLYKEIFNVDPSELRKTRFISP